MKIHIYTIIYISYILYDSDIYIYASLSYQKVCGDQLILMLYSYNTYTLSSEII